MAKTKDEAWRKMIHEKISRNIPKPLRSCDTAEVNRLIQIVERKDTEIEALKLRIKELEAKA